MNYFDLAPEYSGDNSRVAILPVPFESTTSYGKGTAKGPHAILVSSHHVETWDEELESEVCSVGIQSLNPMPVQGPHQDVLNRLEETVAGLAGKEKFPVILGGEHSITPGAVRGVAKYTPNVTVVQLDAHADLRQEYQGSPLNHACTMARVRDQFPAVQIGIRSLSKVESDWIKRDALPVFFAHDMANCDDWMESAIGNIKTDNVYITFDVDVLDSSLVPCTGTPDPGGLHWYEVTTFLRKLTQVKRVVGFDIVELAPVDGFHAPDFLIAKLLYKMIGYWITGKQQIASQ